MLLTTLLAASLASESTPSPAEALVHGYTIQHFKQTFRPPSGKLKFPYLVPAGYYQQLWDWDSMITGTALLELGSAPYLAGSMKNFLSGVDLSTGMVKGCLTPDGATPTIYHAKPVLIQGAWIGAKHTSDFEQFREFLPQMKALDRYWETTKDRDTGLFQWHDQLESGCDNLITSECPSTLGTGPPAYEPCWVKSDAFSLGSADIATFIYREKVALSLFLAEFGDRAGAAAMRASADDLHRAIDTHLWDPEERFYVALNTSSKTAIKTRTHLMGFAVFGGASLVNQSQARGSFAALSQPDMLSAYGIRSASSQDPRYTNGNYVKPYSNWRGPIWVNTNLMIAYGLGGLGMQAEALDVASRVVEMLAAALRQNPAEAKNGTAWRECYSSEDGAGLAAPGFLNWNLLAGNILGNLRAGTNPFGLEGDHR